VDENEEGCCSLRQLLSYEGGSHESRSTSTLADPGWKWEEVSMDFIYGLPPSIKSYDSIWVIVDHLTKVARFIPVRTEYRLHQYAELYFKHIVRQYGVPRTIILDRGP